MPGWLTDPTVYVALVAVVVLVAAGLVIYRRLRRRHAFASPLERATFSTLHTVSLAAPALREGLSESSAQFAVPYLRTLLDTEALSMTAADCVPLAWDGDAEHHNLDVRFYAEKVMKTGRQQMASRKDIECGSDRCPVKGIVVVPLEVDGNVVGTLAAVSAETPGPVLLRASAEVARYVSSQLELADLDDSRDRLNRAEVRALRAQISPHFIYNALNTVASFIRTDPERARELLMEFADFTRYSFRQAGEYTTLAEELKNIDRYLMLERARFGNRLAVKVQVAPEVLSVVLPFLALQPLVENAVRHGLAGKVEGGTVTLTAEDSASECLITVEDNGVGMDPQALREDNRDAHLSGAHVGLGNVDDRMRSAFGPDYGLVVETERGAGTKISLRVPKFRAGVRV
ncbi:sensor histidine kinase [Actinomycetospora sp. TBRC 11914]|uniref:sensor histidine kinase n=1 Tax=Actinomycetospora sp. TBRC 11914 TaxID=2729387 RepID=UPI00145DDE12|nr:histidine kinase [Actinomycetospora sp. TBRC 11914]NMO90136.1 histidine kinase [Actinomycetospora sp. TBRC 11914]